ncbi:hypothetical protein DVH05_025641 [Phytophthora capsici]|nr:hypothetical protein DVH05_025641 [Phytophthora capsici]
MDRTGGSGKDDIGAVELADFLQRNDLLDAGYYNMPNRTQGQEVDRYAQKHHTHWHKAASGKVGTSRLDRWYVSAKAKGNTGVSVWSGSQRGPAGIAFAQRGYKVGEKVQNLPNTNLRPGGICEFNCSTIILIAGGIGDSRHSYFGEVMGRLQGEHSEGADNYEKRGAKENHTGAQAAYKTDQTTTGEVCDNGECQWGEASSAEEAT